MEKENNIKRNNEIEDINFLEDSTKKIKDNKKNTKDIKENNNSNNMSNISLN